MNINERLASLEATVRSGFELAARDRIDVKERLDKHNGQISDTFKAIGLRLDMHDGLINQGRGFQKALTWIWGILLATWGFMEGYFHIKGPK